MFGGKEDLIFRLRKDASTYYYVDSTGAVATSPTPVTLVDPLTDAGKLLIIFSRHSNYKGVLRKYMPDMYRFINDAAKILRYLFNTQGRTAAKCQLEIQKLNSSDLMYYPLVVVGINYSRYLSANLWVDVALSDDGLAAKLNAYDTTTYALQIGEPQGAGAEPYGPTGPPVSLYMDGVPFVETFNYVTTPNDVINTAILIPERTIGVNFIDKEDLFFNSQGSINVGTPTTVPSGVFPSAADNFFKSVLATNNATLTVTINIASIVNGPTVGAVHKVIARLYDAAGTTVIANHAVYSSPPMGSGATIAPGIISSSFNYADTGGYQLVLLMETTGVSGTMTLGASPTDITLTYNSKADDSLVAAYSHYQVLQMLAANIVYTNPVPAGTKFPLTMGAGSAPPVGYNNMPAPPVKSDLLSTSASYWDVNPTQTYFTSGNAIRNLQYTGNGVGAPPRAYLSMTFKDFMKDAFVSLCAGLGIENIGGVDTIRLEHLSHFYQKNVLIKDLGGEIKDFEIEPYNDDIGTNVKAGYRKNSYGDANGLWEYNTGMEFTTSALNEERDIDLTSPFRADPYGIETTRYNNTGSTSTDAESDSEVFKIQSNGVDGGIVSGYGFIKPPYNAAPFYPPSIALPTKSLKRNHDAATMSGLPQIGVPYGVGYFVFNIPLSPKRQIKRLLPYLKSLYHGYPTPKLTFQRSDRQLNLVSSIVGGAGVIDEWADEDLTPSGSDFLFQPVVFSFTCEAPSNLIALMEAKPYGVFGFTWKKHYMEGFVLEVGLYPGQNNVYRMKLLCSPNTTIPVDL